MNRKTELILFLVIVIGFSIAVLLYNGWTAWHDVKIWLAIGGSILLVWLIGDGIDKRKEKKRLQDRDAAIKREKEKI